MKRILLLLPILFAGCATPQARQQVQTWRTICAQAPYHGGDTLSKPVLLALYTLPSFPDITTINRTCAR